MRHPQLIFVLVLLCIFSTLPLNGQTCSSHDSSSTTPIGFVDMTQHTNGQHVSGEGGLHKSMGVTVQIENDRHAAEYRRRGVSLIRVSNRLSTSGTNGS